MAPAAVLPSALCRRARKDRLNDIFDKSLAVVVVGEAASHVHSARKRP